MEEPEFDPAAFVYVKLQEPTGPLERGEKFEDALDEALKATRLGEVTGGGSQLGDPHPDGTPTIEFCGLDITVTDLEPALALLREHLVRLAAPVGTELHYTVEGARLQDELSERGWAIAKPRSSVHPYFLCWRFSLADVLPNWPLPPTVALPRFARSGARGRTPVR